MKIVVENKYVVVYVVTQHTHFQSFLYILNHLKHLSATFPLNQMNMYLSEDPSDLKLHCQYYRLGCKICYITSCESTILPEIYLLLQQGMMDL